MRAKERDRDRALEHLAYVSLLSSLVGPVAVEAALLAEDAAHTREQGSNRRLEELAGELLSICKHAHAAGSAAAVAAPEQGKTHPSLGRKCDGSRK
jgi:hypothetical protein